MKILQKTLPFAARGKVSRFLFGGKSINFELAEVHARNKKKGNKKGATGVIPGNRPDYSRGQTIRQTVGGDRERFNTSQV